MWFSWPVVGRWRQGNDGDRLVVSSCVFFALCADPFLLSTHLPGFVYIFFFMIHAEQYTLGWHVKRPMNTLHVSIKRSVFFFNTSISWLQYSAASNRNDRKSQVQDQSEGNRIRATRFSCSVARKCRPFHPKEEQKKKRAESTGNKNRRWMASSRKPSPSCRGDPHFLRWTGHRRRVFYFHVFAAPQKSPSIEPTDIQPSGNKLAVSPFDIPAGMCK